MCFTASIAFLQVVSILKDIQIKIQRVQALAQSRLCTLIFVFALFDLYMFISQMIITYKNIDLQKDFVNHGLPQTHV